jgi:hypothetical protein
MKGKPNNPCPGSLASFQVVFMGPGQTPVNGYGQYVERCPVCGRELILRLGNRFPRHSRSVLR